MSGIGDRKQLMAQWVLKKNSHDQSYHKSSISSLPPSNKLRPSNKLPFSVEES